MQRRENISLVDCKSGKASKVIAVLGDRNIKERLEALGIRKGSVVTKKFRQPGYGPVIVTLGSLEIAIGYELAQNVIVVVEE